MKEKCYHPSAILHVYPYTSSTYEAPDSQTERGKPIMPLSPSAWAQRYGDKILKAWGLFYLYMDIPALCDDSLIILMTVFYKRDCFWFK